ncbi:hypothetical protein J1614_011868 [Plenodomus biglobosus]|nr:hypothetical protein J1614_011868 [Plenodomus biglobosus]
MRSRVMAARELTYQHTCPSKHALKWTDATTPLVGPVILRAAIGSINRTSSGQSQSWTSTRHPLLALAFPHHVLRQPSTWTSIGLSHLFLRPNCA